MAAGYANTDKMKAIELFNKTLAIDPEMDMQSNQLRCLRQKIIYYVIEKTDS
jgi:hypothetical protein